MEIAYSVNGIPIRLMEERWQHIIDNKPYMMGYDDIILDVIENPIWILRGYAGALIAVQPASRRRYLHVIYKEVSQDDGFIITAYIARKLNRKMIIWSQNS